MSDAESADPGEIWALERGRAPRDLSKSHFADQMAAVSPTGAKVAFWSNRKGIWQVFLVGTNGHGLHPVFTVERRSDYYLDWPSFSQDGRTLVLQYRTATTIPRPRARLAFVDLRTGRTRRLRSPCIAGSGSVSPDGRRIACPVEGAKIAVIDRTGRRLFAVRGDWSQWIPPDRIAVRRLSGTLVLDPSGAVLARLRGSAGPVSADGRLLALIQSGRLTVVDLSTYRPIRTIEGRRDWDAYWVAFTPDGREIAYTAFDESGRITPVRGGPIRRFPQPWGTWSSDAHYAFFRPASKGRVAVAVGDRYGRGATVAGRFWSDDHSISQLLPASGERFVYESSGVRPHRGLWTVRPDGSGLRRLSDTGDDLSGPAWSADGSRLAYASAKGPPSGNAGFCCGRRIVIAAPDGRKLSLLPLGDDFDAYPSWSPDGTRLVVEHGFYGEIDVLQANGAGRRVLTKSGRSPAWSPDGATIAYASFDGDGIHTISPDGTNDRKLLAGGASSVAWSPDGRLLAYTTADGLFVAASDGSGSPRRVASVKLPNHPSFSPDSNQIAFTVTLQEYPTHFAIFVVDADGTDLRALVSDWYNASDPAWRPAP